VQAPPPVFDIVLPLGISFYTFETIACVVDVYRRRLPAERHALDYALFLLFFPHLIAGPIVRAHQFCRRCGGIAGSTGVASSWACGSSCSAC
jgi:alginate O-acetyltransferase complex protein AlgI